MKMFLNIANRRIGIFTIHTHLENLLNTRKHMHTVSTIGVVGFNDKHCAIQLQLQQKLLLAIRSNEI